MHTFQGVDQKLFKFLYVFILLISISFLNISGCGGDGNGNSVTKTIGTEGGTIESKDGKIILEIPAGALTEDTEITVERFEDLEGNSGLVLFEFLPDGLEFLIPATLKIDISDTVNTENGAIEFSEFPILITQNLNKDDLEVLENLELNIDGNTGEAFVSADLTHFTKGVSGGEAGVTGVINGVPLMHPANTSFPTVEVSITSNRPDEIGSSLADIAFIKYNDSSTSPVIYEGGDSLSLRPIPKKDATQVYSIPYSCGPVGTGKFVATLDFGLREIAFETHYDEGEINIVAAFLFSLEAVPEPISVTTTTITLTNFILSASRDVMCVGGEIGPPPPPPPPTEQVVCEDEESAFCEKSAECNEETTVESCLSDLDFLEEEFGFPCEKVFNLSNAQSCVADLNNFSCQEFSIAPPASCSLEGTCDICETDDDCNEGQSCFVCEQDCTGVDNRCSGVLFSRCEDGIFRTQE